MKVHFLIVTVILKHRMPDPEFTVSEIKGLVGKYKVLSFSSFCLVIFVIAAMVHIFPQKSAYS